MKSILTAAAFAAGVGLALPALAQTTTPKDPALTSPLAKADARQGSALAAKDPAQESPLAKPSSDSSPLAKPASANDSPLAKPASDQAKK